MSAAQDGSWFSAAHYRAPPQAGPTAGGDFEAQGSCGTGCWDCYFCGGFAGSIRWTSLVDLRAPAWDVEGWLEDNAERVQTKRKEAIASGMANAHWICGQYLRRIQHAV